MTALLTVQVRAANLPAVRAHARKTGLLSGLDGLQQTRFSTAVSEIARNAVQHGGGGTVTFEVEVQSHRQALVAVIADHGPGIPDLNKVLGSLDGGGRLPMGIAGSSRLVDRITVQAPESGGTVVRLEMYLPRTAVRLTPERIGEIIQQLNARGVVSPLEEVEQQNRELLKAHQELRAKQAELERADERKNQFVATLAHELRGPLGTLKLTLDLMRLRPTTDLEELARRRERMERQSSQMSQLIEDLMETSQITQGKVALAKELTDLNSLVAQSIEMSEGSTEPKGHEVRVDVPAKPIWVHADRRRMKQVFCNLIQNSARYTPANGHISVSVSATDAIAVVQVRDDGRGIAAELLPHVFDLFVQGSREDARDSGLGVGLSLVRRLVQDHDGTVVAESDGPGLGSVFTVTLPIAMAEQQTAA